MIGHFYIALIVYILSTLLNAELTPQLELQDGSPLVGNVLKPLQDEPGKVWAFLGIPYGQPPVGPLRFKPTKAAQPWTQVFNATKCGNLCQQRTAGNSFANQILKNNLTVSEDCLSINVWTPEMTNSRLKKRDRQLAVIVYIHGGGYHLGTACDPSFSGANLALMEKVVVVTMNYRLSIYGLLYTGGSEAPGNVGLLDQVLALQWVKKNIATFRGDPNQVTIAGVSSGAASVGLHGLSPLSANLFNRLIMMSASALSGWAVRDAQPLKEQVITLAHIVGCPNTTSPVLKKPKGAKSSSPSEYAPIVECLRSKPVAQLSPALPYATSEISAFTWAPVRDDIFLTGDPINLLKEGRFKKADVLLGGMINEAFFLITNFYTSIFNSSNPAPVSLTYEKYRSMLTETVHPRYRENNATLAAILNEYLVPENDTTDVQKLGSLENALSDEYYVCPQDLVGKFYDQKRADVYRFVFTQNLTIPSLPAWAKSPHGFDGYFMWGTALLTYEKDKTSTVAQAERRLSLSMMRYYANFARTGDPNMNVDNTRSSPDWPEFGPKHNYLNFNEQNPRPETWYRKRRCDFWNEQLPKLLKANSAQG